VKGKNDGDFRKEGKRGQEETRSIRNRAQGGDQKMKRRKKTDEGLKPARWGGYKDIKGGSDLRRQTTQKTRWGKKWPCGWHLVA